MENTNQTAVLQVQTLNGKVTYQGDAQIDGVPGKSAPVTCEFKETAGSTCGALYPSGNLVDSIDGIDVTLIDNGMPVVVLNASDFGISGTEPRDELDNNVDLKRRLESIRLQAGPMMSLGDVAEKSVPKMSLVSGQRKVVVFLLVHLSPTVAMHQSACLARSAWRRRRLPLEQWRAD